MPLCPILSSDCVKSECAWWINIADDNDDFKGCAVRQITYELLDIKEKNKKILSKINDCLNTKK
jgi:hypothetical protein